MAKFDLKKAILENKATFFSSLTEGQFSWMTQDTGQQIGSQDENMIPVYMFDDKGKYYYENDYEGYGVFGGKDYYDLVAEMNGYTADDAKELGGTFGELRGVGIKLAFGELEPKNGGPVLFPALVTKPDKFNYKSHDFTQEAETDPNQSWYEPEEDEEDNSFDLDDDEDYGYNDEEEELDEIKEIKPTTKMKKSELKAKIKEMVLAEYERDVDYTDETAGYDFLAELEGMLDEADGLTPLQDYVYQYEIEISGEDQAQEYLDDIKKLNTPDDVYDYYAYGRDWQGSMDDDLENIYRQVKRKFKNLSEADETEKDTAEVDTTDVAVDDTETVTTSTEVEVDPDVKAVQDALTQAQVAAQKLGDKKLTDQIGNTITFFTREHVVEKPKAAVAEEASTGIKENQSSSPKLLDFVDGDDRKTLSTYKMLGFEVEVDDEVNNVYFAEMDFKGYDWMAVLAVLEDCQREGVKPNMIWNDKNYSFDEAMELADNKAASDIMDDDGVGTKLEAKSMKKSVNESMFPMLKKILK